MIRFLTLAILMAVSVLPARSAEVYFVALAEIHPQGQAQYDEFLSKVAPIWQRHGMSLVRRYQTVEAIADDTNTRPPDEIALIAVASRKQFQNYLRDEDYLAIKQLRIEATSRFTVIEADLRDSAFLAYLGQNPMACLKFQSRVTTAHAGQSVFDVTLVGNVKGPPPTYLPAVKSISVQPVSFDDNPMDFAADGGRLLSVIARAVPVK